METFPVEYFLTLLRACVGIISLNWVVSNLLSISNSISSEQVLFSVHSTVPFPINFRFRVSSFVFFYLNAIRVSTTPKHFRADTQNTLLFFAIILNKQIFICLCPKKIRSLLDFKFFSIHFLDILRF